MDVDDIAQICHEANRAYCATTGDLSQPAWEHAPDWQRASAISGVKFHLANPDAGPSGSHENWMREKLAQGWRLGPRKDPGALVHPCLVPYDQLPERQRLKDALFVGIVHSLKHAVQHG